jgi:DNA-binding transcriptional ArsR family regulator
VDETHVAHNELIAEEQAVELADLFRAMGDANRMRIVSVLIHHELCVHDIASLVDMSQSAVSHQLRALRQMRLVKSRRDGRNVYYTLDDDHVRQLFEVGLEHVAGL